MSVLKYAYRWDISYNLNPSDGSNCFMNYSKIHTLCSHVLQVCWINNDFLSCLKLVRFMVSNYIIWKFQVKINWLLQCNPEFVPSNLIFTYSQQTPCLFAFLLLKWWLTLNHFSMVKMSLQCWNNSACVRGALK